MTEMAIGCLKVINSSYICIKIKGKCKKQVYCSKLNEYKYFGAEKFVTKKVGDFATLNKTKKQKLYLITRG